MRTKPCRQRRAFRRLLQTRPPLRCHAGSRLLPQGGEQANARRLPPTGKRATVVATMSVIYVSDPSSIATRYLPDPATEGVAPRMDRRRGCGRHRPVHPGGLHPGVDYLLAHRRLRLRPQAPTPPIPAPARRRPPAAGHPARPVPQARRHVRRRHPYERQPRRRFHRPSVGAGAGFIVDNPAPAASGSAARRALRGVHPARLHPRGGARLPAERDHAPGGHHRRGRHRDLLTATTATSRRAPAGDRRGPHDRAGRSHPLDARRRRPSGAGRPNGCSWARTCSPPSTNARTWAWTRRPGCRTGWSTTSARRTACTPSTTCPTTSGRP